MLLRKNITCCDVQTLWTVPISQLHQALVWFAMRNPSQQAVAAPDVAPGSMFANLPAGND